ncbi:hypothetical protein SKAU_G00229500 [Synaphobranchus kaupii]|uniref:Uncharacterized protein n=1 Tax=Synaphobranchus kaupii TaxID=118154 RepID=A0A9Q1IT46_SYNKA|nr:hypothetical protein SKAU_G00229500 [Synaphobranchus kaupii]
MLSKSDLWILAVKAFTVDVPKVTPPYVLPNLPSFIRLSRKATVVVGTRDTNPQSHVRVDEQSPAAHVDNPPPPRPPVWLFPPETCPSHTPGQRLALRLPYGAGRRVCHLAPSVHPYPCHVDSVCCRPDP